MYEPKDLATNDYINEKLAHSAWWSDPNYWIGINNMTGENNWMY